MNLYPAKASRSWTVVALIIAVIWLFPILFALGTSFRPLQDVFANVVNFIPIPPTLENYAKLAGRLDLPRVIANTFSIAATVTLLKLLTAFLAAYAFTYFEFRGGRNKIYFVFLATIFVPFTVTMIPNYLLIARIGLGDNILGVILTQVADASGILLMVAAMREIPYSLIESAKLDDVSDRRIMLDMVLPLVRPQLTATGIWFFVNSWNEFVWPSLILRSEQSYTLPLALQMFVSAEGGTDFAVAMAVSVVTMLIPVVLYLTFQKYIIGTFTGAGIK